LLEGVGGEHNTIFREAEKVCLDIYSHRITERRSGGLILLRETLSKQQQKSLFDHHECPVDLRTSFCGAPEQRARAGAVNVCSERMIAFCRSSLIIIHIELKKVQKNLNVALKKQATVYKKFPKRKYAL
jgi:hypothetical protein